MVVILEKEKQNPKKYFQEREKQTGIYHLICCHHVTFISGSTCRCNQREFKSSFGSTTKPKGTVAEMLVSKIHSSAFFR